MSCRDGGYKASAKTNRGHVWIGSTLHCVVCGMPRESVWSERIGPICISPTSDRAARIRGAFAREKVASK